MGLEGLPKRVVLLPSSNAVFYVFSDPMRRRGKFYEVVALDLQKLSQQCLISDQIAAIMRFIA